MACGVPVVASAAGSLAEVVGAAAYAVNPDDGRRMGGAIIATVVEPQLAEELKRTGLAQAARFSWEKTATETLLVYDKIWQRNGAGRL
jgi:glycosyltransferase involved in cell wall biosynthesis